MREGLRGGSGPGPGPGWAAGVGAQYLSNRRLLGRQVKADPVCQTGHGGKFEQELRPKDALDPLNPDGKRALPINRRRRRLEGVAGLAGEELKPLRVQNGSRGPGELLGVLLAKRHPVERIRVRERGRSNGARARVQGPGGGVRRGDEPIVLPFVV